jgi:hypothetical protein
MRLQGGKRQNWYAVRTVPNLFLSPPINPFTMHGPPTTDVGRVIIFNSEELQY